MLNAFKKVLSLLFAISILISGMPFANLFSINAIAAEAETFWGGPDNAYKYSVGSSEDGNYISITGFSSSKLSGEIVIPSEIDGLPVKNLSGIVGLKNVTKITIPKTVTYISNYGNPPFNECDKLEEIAVEEGNEHYVSVDGVLFSVIYNYAVLYKFPQAKECENYNIPEKIFINGTEKPVTKIAKNAFDECKNLKGKLTIPDSIGTIESDAFNYCTKLAFVDVSENNQAYYDIDGVLMSKSGNFILYPSARSGKSYIIPDGITRIDSYAFIGCDNLEEITVPDSVVEIGNYAIRSNAVLKKINISETSNLKTIKYNGIDYCESLVDFYIPAKTEDIGANFLEYCSSLEAINVSPENACYSSIDGVLFNKNQTTVILHPQNRSNFEYIIPDTVTTIGNGAFEYCSNLERIEIPYGVEEIEGSAFRCCYNLTGLNLPDSITTIGSQAFNGCKSLTSVSIPEGVTQYHNSWFDECNNLIALSIPKSIVDVDNGSYGNERSLMNIFYAGTEEEWNNLGIELQNIQAKINFNSAYTVEINKISEDEGNELFLENPNFDKEAYSVENPYYYDIKFINSNGDVISVPPVELILPASDKACSKVGMNLRNDNTIELHSIDVKDTFSKKYNVTVGDTEVERTLRFAPYTVTASGPVAFFDGYKYYDYVLDENNQAFIVSSSHEICGDVKIPAYLDGYTVVGIKNGVFGTGQNITSITIPESVTNIEPEVFTEPYLSLITVDENNPAYSSENGVLFNKDKTTLIRYPAAKREGFFEIPKSVTKIASYAFYGIGFDGNTMVIEIPESVETIGDNSFYCSAYVIYDGTEESWNNITIGENNSALCYVTFDRAFISANGVAILYDRNNFNDGDEVTLIVEDALEEDYKNKHSYEVWDFYNEMVSCKEIHLEVNGEEVTEFDSPITIFFEIPEEYDYNEETEFSICHVRHDDVFEIFENSDEETKLNVLGRKIMISVDSFSPFILGVKDKDAVNTISSVSIKKFPERILLNTEISGVELTVKYADSTSETITDMSKIKIIGFDNTKTGTQTVTVEYEGFTADFEAEVYVKAESVAITKLPVKTSYTYKQGGIDLSGIELTVTYTDGTTETVTDTSKMTLIGFDNTKIGKQTVTVEYEGYTAEFEVTVSYAWWQWIIRILLLGFFWY